MNAEIIRRLTSIDMPAEALREVLKVLADVQSVDDERKAKDRDRKRRVRGRSAEIPTTVQGMSAECPEAKVFPSPPYDINSTPHTPFQNTQSRVREVFDKFWAIYPKRINRKAALAKLETALKAGVDPEKILAGAARYAEHVKFTEPQFIKAPDAWLNAGKWDDELPAEPQKPQARAGPAKSSSGNGFSVLLDELRAKRNGQQSSTNEPRDITPTSVPEPGTGDSGSHLSDPVGKPSGGGEILDFRPASPDARRSPSPFGEAARTFDWDDLLWRTFDGG